MVEINRHDPHRSPSFAMATIYFDIDHTDLIGVWIATKIMEGFAVSEPAFDPVAKCYVVRAVRS